MLEGEVVQLRAENAALRERVGELEQQIGELEEGGRHPPLLVKANRSKSGEPKKPRRKWGQSITRGAGEKSP